MLLRGGRASRWWTAGRVGCGCGAVEWVTVMPHDAEDVLEQFHQARLKAREAIGRFSLSPAEREWVERLGEELILDWSKTLSERLQEDIGFSAIPAIFAYALTVMEQTHRSSATAADSIPQKRDV